MLAKTLTYFTRVQNIVYVFKKLFYNDLKYQSNQKLATNVCYTLLHCQFFCDRFVIKEKKCTGGGASYSKLLYYLIKLPLHYTVSLVYCQYCILAVYYIL